MRFPAGRRRRPDDCLRAQASQSDSLDGHQPAGPTDAFRRGHLHHSPSQRGPVHGCHGASRLPDDWLAFVPTAVRTFFLHEGDRACHWLGEPVVRRPERAATRHPAGRMNRYLDETSNVDSAWELGDTVFAGRRLVAAAGVEQPLRCDPDRAPALPTVRRPGRRADALAAPDASARSARPLGCLIGSVALDRMTRPRCDSDARRAHRGASPALRRAHQPPAHRRRSSMEVWPGGPYPARSDVRRHGHQLRPLLRGRRRCRALPVRQRRQRAADHR